MLMDLSDSPSALLCSVPLTLVLGHGTFNKMCSYLSQCKKVVKVSLLHLSNGLFVKHFPYLL